MSLSRSLGEEEFEFARRSEPLLRAESGSKSFLSISLSLFLFFDLFYYLFLTFPFLLSSLFYIFSFWMLEECCSFTLVLRHRLTNPQLWIAKVFAERSDCQDLRHRSLEILNANER